MKRSDYRIAQKMEKLYLISYMLDELSPLSPAEHDLRQACERDIDELRTKLGKRIFPLEIDEEAGS